MAARTQSASWTDDTAVLRLTAAQNRCAPNPLVTNPLQRHKSPEDTARFRILLVLELSVLLFKA